MENEFRLPLGYRVWCHICGKAPFNKVSHVDGKDIPGVGFKTMQEASEHEKILHRVWKG